MVDRAYFDLEGCSADQLFTGRHEGPFLRLAGVAGDGSVGITVDMEKLLAFLERAGEVVGHNIAGFDLLALAYHHGADWEALMAKARDTLLLARLKDPPMSKEHGVSLEKYDLNHIAQSLEVAGKITGDDGLKALKKEFGGYDKIPVDDSRYVAYLKADVVATRAVAAHYPMTDYGRREHRLASLAGRMTLNGFRVDVPLLRERIAEGERTKAAALKELNVDYGIPLEGKSPLASNAGKAALIRALGQCGIPNDPSGVPYHPKTEKSGAIAAGREGMALIKKHYGDLPGISRLCELVTTVTTIRTVYQTAANHLVGDRVHPRVSMRQASGRWSVLDPGLTVYGKHDGRHHERDIFIGEPGHVIMTCDKSQVDMRAIAGHCQDPAYMALFAPGRDAHQEIADMLGITRQDAKARGHGWNYGLGAKRMIAEGADPDVVWKFVKGMESRFPTLMAWRDDIRDRGGRGELLDNGFGRLMRCHPSAAYTVAPALMGQGGARDIMCEALLRLPDWMRPYFRTMVHDEVVLSVPEHLADVVGRTVKEAFTWEWRGVPILCELSKPGHSWGDVSEK
jgi:DNA polymerase-1